MKRLLFVISAAFLSTYSLSMPFSDERNENGSDKVLDESPCLRESGGNADLQVYDYEVIPNENLQSGRNPANKKRGGNTRKQSRAKASKKEVRRPSASSSRRANTADRGTKRITPKKNHGSDMGGGLFVDAFGGYSNFVWSEGSPVAGLGFGAGISGCFHLHETDFAPEGYFAEAGIHYVRRGSGAFPIDYAGAKVLPLGYCFNHLIGDFSLFIKGGGYVAYPFSKIETRQNSFDTNLDYGAIGSVGV